MISLRQIIKEVVKEELPFENMDSAEKRLWRKFEKLIQRCGGDMETLFKGKGKIEFPDEEKEFVKIILVQLAREEGLSHKIWKDKDGNLSLKEAHDFIQYFIDYLIFFFIYYFTVSHATACKGIRIAMKFKDFL